MGEGNGDGLHNGPDEVVSERLWQAVHLVLDDDPRAGARLRDLRAMLAEEEHPAVGFVLDAIEARLAHRPPMTLATCVRQGRRWRIGLGTRAVLVDHRVGMLHLAVLIANPGVEISARDLAAGVQSLTRAAGPGVMSNQLLLDYTAVKRYRARLSELRRELDDPDQLGDPGHARTERDWLLRELTAVSAPGRTSRAFTENKDRARVAVSRAIRRALDHIEAADAAVATHLRAAVHTGVYCWYRPA